jgi:predicted transcriptional regulator
MPQSKKASSNGKSTVSPKRSSTTTTTPKRSSSPSGTDRAREAVERAVDLPVGAVLEVSDRVTDLVAPFTGRAAAEKQLKSYRTRVTRSVKRTERRGAIARRKAATEARKTRKRVEREARNRRRNVERTLKRNRTEVEERVRSAVEEQTSRAQNLVDQVGSQLGALR